MFDGNGDYNLTTFHPITAKLYWIKSNITTISLDAWSFREHQVSLTMY